MGRSVCVHERGLLRRAGGRGKERTVGGNGRSEGKGYERVGTGTRDRDHCIIHSHIINPSVNLSFSFCVSLGHV